MAHKIDVKSIDVHALYRKYTLSSKDAQCFVLDVRPNKEFKRSHLLLSYSIRLTSDGRALADYSKSSYEIRWTQKIWWNADVIIYGDPGLKKDNDVATFLAKEGRCRSVSVYKAGLKEVEAVYPFLVTASTKAHRKLVYPSQIIAEKLYLGDWAAASDHEKLQQLRIKRIITIHNDPENLKVPAKMKHMKVTAADLPSTDLSCFFNATYEFIEEGAAGTGATLVHCGSGSSRSSTICAAYLMRKHAWPARRALMFLVERRSKVCPNEGFWRQLCAFEEVLGLPAVQRSNVADPPVVDESYGQMVDTTVAADAAGKRLEVRVLGRDYSAQRDDATAGKRPRRDPEEEPLEGKRSAQVRDAALAVDIVKDGKVVGALEMPVLSRHQRCVFGRAPNCDVKLEHASISRQHAQLTVDAGGSVFLADMGSAHGTNVDGAWVKASQPKEVRVGTKFRFGASSRTYVVTRINVSR